MYIRGNRLGHFTKFKENKTKSKLIVVQNHFTNHVRRFLHIQVIKERGWVMILEDIFSDSEMSQCPIPDVLFLLLIFSQFLIQILS